jgi:pimeloyl-ACP methyl ester carboxylesterase
MDAASAKPAIDRYPPEKAKFKSAIVLVHGLWTGGWCWNSWATHLANLGWECLAVTLPGRLGEASDQTLKLLTLEKCVEAVTGVIRGMAEPPVILAHGTGGLIAFKAAEETPVAALIVASAVPPRNLDVERSRALRLLRLKYLPLVYLRRPFRIEDKDLRRVILYPLPVDQQAAIARRIVPESNGLVAELLAPQVRLHPEHVTTAALILSGSMDVVVPPGVARAFAAWLGAGFREYPGQGHWMIESDGETIVRDVHRWLIHELGEQILLVEGS